MATLDLTPQNTTLVLSVSSEPARTLLKLMTSPALRPRSPSSHPSANLPRTYEARSSTMSKDLRSLQRRGARRTDEPRLTEKK